MISKNLGNKILDFYSNRYQELAGYHLASDYPSLPEMLFYLSTLPDRIFGYYAFLREPMHGKLSFSDENALIERCMQEGRLYATKIQRQYGTILPSQLAQSLNVKIERPFRPVGGSRVLFAEFEEPCTIRIYQSAIAKARETIQANGLESFFHDIDIEEVLIAHELFH